MTAQQALLDKIYQQFPALKHKNFRLYFTGQLISFTGTWLQGVAWGWLVFNLTGSPFWLGIVSALSTLPILFLAPFGGLLAEKFSRKKVLYFTQGSSLLLAFILGLLTLAHAINLPILLLLALLAGTINALDNPATQAFMVDIVDKEDIPSAVGLNSSIINTGVVIGSAIAGFLIALIGVGNIFLINALSFLAILASLYFIKLETNIIKSKENPILAIKEGITYSFNHPLIFILLLSAGVGSIFCFSQATIMPVFAKNVFHSGSSGLGYLLSVTGLGALSGSLIVSSKSKKYHAIHLMVIGNIIFLLSSFIFTLSSSIYLAAGMLFFSGLGMNLQFATMHATVQRLVKEEFRSRVTSLYFLMFAGLGPLGNIFIGSASSAFGPQTAIRICLFIVSLYAIGVYLYAVRKQEQLREYTQKLQPVFTYTKD
ncbi:MAG: permease [uncultured bacterium]|uniref:Permease n=1 Tax=Candidatus Daviesbacteria bacterium GW2011_GWC2_40_12 TaxID=1618431 RepID=A0A0G0QP60_9BACT|nr:MAG: permease [uncultured bacterium]KKQ84495.1 MAG: Permease [Candidatus Daviesbacteria bacterium GW2011_GWF2_38_7]KKR16139.1 MAG: Permease [Candidatus Daviesbacteria bacterium GW2011_GWA2_39_33]KKR41918.1 MAG: Permease [Candidatus Daviesbacteria bacterium GW2011_GWC2_40_12]OGE21785.1 MAG: hypothetical protein A2778_04940 [Candidatus Daviesbacteria bacterium RIFCSPHIGHO2_01_FULL_40_24]OGE29457.1 MAG: hypothetical protein A3C29_00335 [Candidatus Daviesbacteria bacterium RIFCSPHIGHO2_02_FULL_